MWYLDLPLYVRRLKKVYFQPLIDGVCGCNLTQVERVSLIKFVLSSEPVYFLTANRPNKEVLEVLDKPQRRFVWASDKQLAGGKCKVN
jgi:hypothetical protein